MARPQDDIDSMRNWVKAVVDAYDGGVKALRVGRALIRY